MDFLRFIHFFFLAFLSGTSIQASEDIMMPKYRISFIGLELMKMEQTFHMDVVRGQEVEEITYTLAEAYQPFIINNKSFLNHQKQVALINASGELKKFLEQAFVRLEEKFFPEPHQTKIPQDDRFDEFSQEESNLSSLAATILPPTEPPSQDPPDEKENQLTNLFLSNKEDLNSLKFGSFIIYPEEQAISSSGSVSNVSSKTKELEKQEAQMQEDQSFDNLLSSQQESNSNYQVLLEKLLPELSTAKHSFYFQELILLSRLLQVQRLQMTIMDTHTLVNSILRKACHNQSNIIFKHFNKLSSTFLNISEKQQSVARYQKEFFSSIQPLALVNSITKKPIGKNLGEVGLKTSLRKAKVFASLAPSQTIIIFKTFSLSLQEICDYVHAWFAMNKSFFKFQTINFQTAMFLAYILTFILFCYPYISGLRTQPRTKVRRR